MRTMRTALPTSLLAVSFAASLLVGCTDAASPDADGYGPIGTQEDPVPARTGPYQLVTTVDFTIEAILPPQIEEVVVTLRTFSTNPATSWPSASSAPRCPACSRTSSRSGSTARSPS
jgi:hypothetical protein